MQRCIDLALLGKGFTKTNPMVGCVIVHQNNIIAEGYHEKFGEAHAEVNAFNQIANKSILAECDVFVSLEPCSFSGKTPACTDLFAANPCKRLVIGMLDPHSKVNGIPKLKALGIELKTGVLEKECKELNKAFIKSIDSKRPYVIAKWAQSEDGFIAKTNERTAISNELVNEIAQQWRRDNDAYLIGSKTLHIDSPKLTLRTLKGNQPLRCVIGTHIDTHNSFFERPEPGIVFSTNEDLQFPTHFKQFKTVKAAEVLEILYQKNCGTIVIEGGANTICQFSEYIDEVRIITNHSLKIGEGTKAPQLDLTVYTEGETVNLRDNSIKTFYKA